jgi:hypothetical protein
MQKRGIKAISVTGEKSTKETWKNAEQGKYHVILAAPEAIFEKTGYFWNNVLRKRSGALYSRIAAVGIDECHCVKNWGGTGFRMDYNSIGILRETFPNIPFLGLTATITPTGISYFFKSTRFKRPAIIRQTVRRRNVDIWIAPVIGNEYEDLCVLFPGNISSARDIPQTIIFYNGRVGCVRMAKWLRSRLSVPLRSEGETIVRSYSGVLDEASKTETLELLRNGACRIVACTDAFGLGMNIARIPRVVVWKLDAKVGIDGLHQRTGRAGRDTDERVLALIFVTKANLSGQYQSPTRKVTVASREETSKQKKTKQTEKQKHVSPTETPGSPAGNDEFRYTLSISKETEPIFKRALPDIYAGPTKKALATHSESNLPAAVHWVIQTEGCRQQPFLVAFQDPEMMRECDSPGGCDRCCMRHLAETNAIDSPPILHGIPFTITLAYQTDIQTPTDKPRKKRKLRMRTITTDRMDKLVADIKSWRKETLDDFSKRFALPVEIVLPDYKVAAIAGKMKNVGSEDDLIAALKECGYSIPASFISPYTKDLFFCISNSLQESHPSPQLQERFDQAAGLVANQCHPAQSVAAQEISVISPSAQPTPSIPPFVTQQQHDAPSVNNLLPRPEQTATSRIPNWPIPSLPPISHFPQRVPLAEKHDSNTGSINIPVAHLPFTPHNTRRSASSSSMSKQFPAVFSTSLEPVNDKGTHVSKQKNPRKHDGPGNENSVSSVPASKKRKPTQT